jgi:hypothetical protein
MPDGHSPSKIIPLAEQFNAIAEEIRSCRDPVRRRSLLLQMRLIIKKTDDLAQDET